MKQESIEWEINDCRRYIAELLTKEESEKIETTDAKEQLKITRKDLIYWENELIKKKQQG